MRCSIHLSSLVHNHADIGSETQSAALTSGTAARFGTLDSQADVAVKRPRRKNQHRCTSRAAKPDDESRSPVARRVWSPTWTAPCSVAGCCLIRVFWWYGFDFVGVDSEFGESFASVFSV